MINCRADEYEITINPDRLDVDLVHRWLSTDAFWALGRSRETVERASLNFGLYDTDNQQLREALAIAHGQLRSARQTAADNQ
ncbi:hypothetical protein [Nocardia sp. CA-119907]|uniref:hypothetical protein n=1 Tax=Nocardia sp. CA-119907 TaxID=3239973 RepID=UPI003D972671